MTDSKIDEHAKVLWDYLRLHETLTKSDVIFCLCSHDTRVAERAAQLMLDGFGDVLVLSGGAGKLTQGMFRTSEAEAFADIARKMGVPSGAILIEPSSTNTGENIRFTYDLLKQKDMHPKRMLLVQKPYMERRTYATFKKQWPDSAVDIQVTSPQIDYDEYTANGSISKEDILNIMVGDMQRIREYPKLGFQIEQEIPDNVWQSYKKLVALGFTKHLIEVRH